MCYVKECFNNVEVTVDITEDNVFTRCPVCGEEIAVDLNALFHDWDGNLTNTALLCRDCAKEFMEVDDDGE